MKSISQDAEHKGKQRQGRIRTESASAKLQDVPLGEGLRPEASRSGPGAPWPAWTKGISDVFIDTCPRRKCPFTSDKESGKGKPGSIGGSGTSSTLGKHPCTGAGGWSQHASPGRA